MSVRVPLADKGVEYCEAKCVSFVSRVTGDIDAAKNRS